MLSHDLTNSVISDFCFEPRIICYRVAHAGVWLPHLDVKGNMYGNVPLERSFRIPNADWCSSHILWIYPSLLQVGDGFSIRMRENYGALMNLRNPYSMHDYCMMIAGIVRFILPKMDIPIPFFARNSSSTPGMIFVEQKIVECSQTLLLVLNNLK